MGEPWRARQPMRKPIQGQPDRLAASGILRGSRWRVDVLGLRIRPVMKLWERNSVPHPAEHAGELTHSYRWGSAAWVPPGQRRSSNWAPRGSARRARSRVGERSPTAPRTRSAAGGEGGGRGPVPANPDGTPACAGLGGDGAEPRARWERHPALTGVSVSPQGSARRGATRVAPAPWTTWAENWARTCSRYRAAARVLRGLGPEAL